MLSAFRSLFNRSSSSQPNPQNPRSRKLAVERASEFFTWFHFESDGEPEPDGPDLLYRFRPSGEAFRGLVSLELTVAPDDGIGAARLALDRRFVAGPEDAFARDLAKSFLTWILDDADRAHVSPLIARIGDFRAANTPVLMAGEPPPLPPRGTSDAYGVFTGDHELAVLTLASATLTLSNAEGRLFIDALLRS